MCGICGVLGKRSAPAADDIVGRMMTRLAHRGPDGEGRHSHAHFSIGHRRLAIIDIEGGKQPMLSPDGRYVLSYNGELYNYRELRDALRQAGTEFRTQSDTEVLLQMLIRYGTEALPKLNGMFAFAFVDLRTGAWILARDHFGIKPLYYLQTPNALVFASEIKAILEHPDAHVAVDSQALQEYLTFQFCLHGRTLFRDIMQLRPGCMLTGRDHEAAGERTYWTLPYDVDFDHTEHYFTSTLRSMISDSVRLQLRSDVPLGAYLSGGIDSAIVTMMARQHTDNELSVFHGRFAEAPAYDESAYARTVSEAANATFHEIVPTARQFVECMPKLAYFMDEPVAGPGLFPQYIVSALAAQNVKVVLGGQGGDEVFAGYARYLVGYLEQAMKGAIFETQEEGCHIVTLQSIVPNLPVLREYQPMLQRFWREGLFDPMDVRYFRLVDRSPDLETILTDDARRAFDREAVFAEFQRIFRDAPTPSYINRMTHFDLKTLLPSLLHVEDRVSMAVSLESRVPLLDARIVALATSMPPAIRFQGGRTKHILKRAVEGILPPKVLKRKDKMGFPVPLSEWMQGGPVREFVGDTLSTQACRERGLFKPDALDAMLNREARFGRQLWGVLCLELWHRTFVDPPSLS